MSVRESARGFTFVLYTPIQSIFFLMENRILLYLKIAAMYLGLPNKVKLRSAEY